MNNAFKLNAAQIENVVDQLVPLVASPDDVEFFRGVLFIAAENMTASAFGALVSKILKSAGA